MSANSSDRDTPIKRTPELDELVREVCQHYALGPIAEGALGGVNRLVPTLCSPFQDLAKAFVHNTESLLGTVSIPYQLAYASAIDSNWQRISAAERILALRDSLDDPALTDAQQDIRARHAADRRMREFLESSKGRDEVVRASCQFLVRALRDQPFKVATQELLCQGVVLAWGTIEVLARECFIGLLNARPGLAENLLRDPVAKRRFDIGKLSLETLASHGFDVSKRMGNILADQQDLSDLISMKAVFGALCPGNSGLISALDNSDLRLLAQQRHVIVHNRGVIDEDYLKNTGTTCSVGDKLAIVPIEFERRVLSSIGAAEQLLAAASATASS